MHSKKFFYFSLAYCFFILYGSLIPFNYHPIPFEQARSSFSGISYLNLGVASRADWVANIILYIPLTFSLAAFSINNTKQFFHTVFLSTLILIFSITLAFSIEFFQQFFPPRTVSINDLIAESMGSVTGLLIWFGFGKKLLKLFSQITLGGKKALIAGVSLYTLGYLFISFFPYDFITSFIELENKLSKGNDAFFVSASCGAIVRCTSKLFSEMAFTIPLGIIISATLKWHPQRSIAVIIIGFVFGVIIESLQLFIISGISQGISIIMRTTGMAIGEKLYKNFSINNFLLLAYPIKKYIPFITPAYFFLLLSLNGWSIFNLQLTDSATESFNNINWLPFYYHYYTSEAVALSSLLSIVIMYIPIGLGLWLYDQNNQKFNRGGIAGIYAAIICLTLEASKLFIASKHADPTNILISFFSALISYKLVNLIYHWFQQSEVNFENTANIVELTTNLQINKPNIHKPILTHSTPLASSIAYLLFAILIWKIIDYPSNSIGLASILLLYGMALRTYPHSWLIVLPGLLPVLDFAPWTGRFFFSELDHFILLTLAINTWYNRHLNPFRYIKKNVTILLILFIIFYLINLLITLLPFQTIDENSFSNYYSQYNGLRVSKGFFWALLLLPSLNYAYQQTSRTKEFFAYGVLFGLTAVILASIWERVLFTGLFDFSTDYRITAMFSSMHTGGGHIDTYLVTTIPFIAILFFNSKFHIWRSLAGAFLFVTSLYVLLVTFSRGPYFAFSIQFIILVALLFIRHKKDLNWRKTLFIPFFVLIIPLVSIPVFEGDFIQQRFSQINTDFSIRKSHWRDAIRMMHDDFYTTLFGMGLGTYPKTYFLNNSENTIPATYAIGKGKGNINFLRLWSGDSLYMEQKVDTNPNSKYILSLDFRSNEPNPALTIPICEKGLLYSFNCQWQTLREKSMKNQWVQINQLIDMKSTGANTGAIMGKLSRRPIKLALYNGKKNTIIDIKNIMLVDTSNTNLIQNGDFSEGLDHWFFSTDNHLPWHSKNIWIQILFDQGWVGIFIFAGLLIYSVSQQIQLLKQENSYSAVLLTSLTGFLIVGVVASPFDAPRITLLFFLTLFISYLSTDGQTKST